MTWQPALIEETLGAGSLTSRQLQIQSANGLNVKGFVYSSSVRVNIEEAYRSFGGLRSRIRYTVNTAEMLPGEKIDGCFYLVTNCGEREIPYTFTIDAAEQGERLAELKRPEDFLQIAEQDEETALRLLDYPEFVQAPFMQDLHVRALYDGLRGHGNRANIMEEFLIGLGVKKPIRLMTDEKPRIYENPESRVMDEIVLRSDSWGYIWLEAEAEGAFLYLPKKSVTQADFADGVCRLAYRILPEHLHAGLNMGSIRLRSPRLTAQIPIMVRVGEKKENHLLYQRELMQVMLHQMEADLGDGRDRHGLAAMRRDIDRLAALDEAAAETDDGKTPHHAQLSAMRAYYEGLSGRGDMDQLLDALEDAGYSEDRREAAGDYYAVMAVADNEKEEGDGDPVYHSRLAQLFARGCRSPYLYARALRYYEEDPQRLGDIGLFEILTLYFGVRKSSVSRELALSAAEALGRQRTYHRMGTRLLMALYEKYPDTEILTALCQSLILGQKRGPRWFIWYERAVKRDVQLTRLYEFFLSSVPEDYGHILPEKVLLYLSYGHESDTRSREVLYSNLLLYGEQNPELAETFKPEMEKFALEQLFKQRINDRLAVIYRRVIHPEMVDRRLAEVLPPVLKACRIRCRDAEMKFVVVRREELMQEDAYLLDHGVASVPVFTDRDLILFQDSYGTRYTSVRHEDKPVMTDAEPLLEAAFAVNRDQPYLLADACSRLLHKENLNGEEAEQLLHADETMKLHPLFRKSIISALLRFYHRAAEPEAGKEKAEKAAALDESAIDRLLRFAGEDLSRRERMEICALLVDNERYKEAWQMLEDHLLTDLPPRYLGPLTDRVILDSLFREDDLTLHVAEKLMEQRRADGVVLDYLCEHFNGTTEQMVLLLQLAQKEHMETYDLEERLVAQMLFTGNMDKLDMVFGYYAASGKTSDNVVRAYFTVRSAQYFLEGAEAGEKVFAYLEATIESSADREKLPDIYLMALTKYYASLPELTPRQRELCQSVVNALIDQGKVFAYFKDLARFIIIPGDILDKEIIEYHGSREVYPRLYIRILPDEENFHEEELREVFHGIYIREKVLFEGEIMEYRIEEEEDGEVKTAAEGSLSCREVPTRAPGNRFAQLNEMSLALDMKNENDLREKMTAYLKKEAAVAKLFTLG